MGYKEYLPSTVENAIVDYHQVQQQRQLLRNNSGNIESSNDNSEGAVADSQEPPYHPPEMLTRPMKFKDAFLSSTVPTETLHDIRRLQNGVIHAASQVTDGGNISMQGLNSSVDDEEFNQSEERE